jgi:hypothetical protein
MNDFRALASLLEGPPCDTSFLTGAGAATVRT